MELGIGDNDMDKTHILPWGTQIMREVDPLTDTVIIQFVKCSGGGIGQAHWEPGKCSVNHSVAQLCPTLRPHGLQHARPPCPSITLRVYSNSCPFSRWCHAIQSSHPLSSSSPPVFNLSQHQGLFKWVSSSHQVGRVLEFQLQHQSFQWTFRADLL